MKACVQRVTEASVTVDGTIVSSVGKGLLVLLGIEKGDSDKHISWMVNKVANLRIFADNDGKMMLSVKDIDGQVLVISQFTLAGDCRKGSRPSFTNAEDPTVAEPMYESFIHELGDTLSNDSVFGGVFGADMKVSLVNDGPVTIIIEKN